MEIILTILGIIAAIVLIKLCFFVVLHIVKYGIVLFFLVGMPIGFAWLVGWMGSHTAWAICKWAFYIGTAYGVITAILHPSEYFNDIANDLNSDSSSSRSHKRHDSDYNDDKDEPVLDGSGRCGYCIHFDRGSNYCPMRRRHVTEQYSGCRDLTYC